MLLVEEAEAGAPALEGVTLKDALEVVGLELEELTGGLAHLAQGEVGPPDLALGTEPVLAAHLELGVQALLLKGTERHGVRLTAVLKESPVSAPVF